MSGKQIFFPAFSGILFIALVHFAQAATDWGTKGVADTSKVKNIMQITDDSQTDQLKMLSGRTWPQGTTAAVDPWSKDGQWIAFTARFDVSDESHEEICKIKPDGTGFTRLTSNALSDSNASFGSDGKIYFTHYTSTIETPNYTYQVWRMNADGSLPPVYNLSAVHTATSSEEDPRISPDATKIAYNKNSLLYVANSDGTLEHKVSGKRADTVTDINLTEGYYSWSPDSQYLAFTGYDGTGYWIYVVKSDGSNANEVNISVTKPPVILPNISHEWPQFSPDGTKIVYQWSEYTGSPDYYTNYNLRVIDVGGTNEKSLDSASSNPLFVWEELGGPFTWSPDSKYVAYRKHYNNVDNNVYYVYLFMVDTTQTTPTPLQLTTDYNDFIPVWSPDGSQILFQSWGGNYSDYPSRENPANGDTGDLLLINLKTFPWPMFMPAVQSGSKK